MLLSSNDVPSGGASITTTNFANKYTNSNTQLGIAVTAFYDAIESLSGLLTASTYKTMLTISGTAGRVPVLGLFTNDGTARIIKLRVTVDGAYVKEITSSSIAQANNGVIAAGAVVSSTSTTINDGEPIKFKTSLLVEIQSSITETDKVRLVYKTFSEA